MQAAAGEQRIRPGQVGVALVVHQPRFQVVKRQRLGDGVPVVRDGIVKGSLGNELAGQRVIAAGYGKFQPPCRGVRIHPRKVPFGAGPILFVHGTPHVAVVFQSRNGTGRHAAEFADAGHGLVERVCPLRGVVGEVCSVNAPIHQVIAVGVQIVGLRSIVVGFAELNGFDAASEGGAFKGVMQLKLSLREHGVNTPLLPSRTTALRGLAAADGDIDRLACRPRAVCIQPDRHRGIAEAEISNVLVAGSHLPHVRRPDFFRADDTPLPTRTRAGSVLGDVGVSKEIGEFNRCDDHAQSRREFFQTTQKTAYAVGEGRTFVGRS